MAETQITRGRGGKNNTPNVQPLDLNPGDNTKYLNHTLMVSEMPPIDHTDVKQVERRISEYFHLCAANDMKPTVAGYCMAIGVSRMTVCNWKNGVHRADTHQAVICKGYDILDALWQDYMMNGKINPVSGIFLGKNLFNYQDKQDIIVTPNTQGETVDVATIEAKYAELPDYDTSDSV
ncbi:terminase small subunit [uncultured Fibrobacter sp.]|uniref:terminase small subunit n=1 Tax=uncultured Fibrobacter sp. TaxID=261512 RepID=UPI0026036608|nr:terminase small subunit [uncultured Fibrobacter sp.]